MRQTGQIDINTLSGQDQFIPKSLLIRHCKPIPGPDLGHRSLDADGQAFPASTTQAVSAHAPLNQTPAFGDELVEIPHVEVGVLDQRVQVRRLIGADIPVQGVTARRRVERIDTDQQTFGFGAQTHEVVLCRPDIVGERRHAHGEIPQPDDRARPVCHDSKKEKRRVLRACGCESQRLASS